MSRRLGAWGLTLALMAVIAAAVIPTCADSLCCARDGEMAMQAQMPCCEPSMSQKDFELQPLKVEDRQSCLSIAALPGQAGSPVLHLRSALDAAVPAGLHPPSPPLFLLHAQFLI